ncbi:ARM repeat superfamily protein [Tasmannia lanceolata]|uniref:ARM repeat superfamily protein n=1 Tax=Tasmannia lanceolata TaxID=3420 RepID=UPI0040646D18
MSDSDSFCFFSYYQELRFFARIRRFLQIKTSRKKYVSSERFEKENREEENDRGVEMAKGIAESCFVLQRSVKQLHFGGWDEKEIAAKEISRLAREDLRTRKSLATLGVIPTLVSMLDSEVSDHKKSAVQALIELANGTYTNKALMVEAGILAKLPNLLGVPHPNGVGQFVVLLLLSLSSLANTQFPFASLEILPFVVKILDSDSDSDSDVTDETKMACLGILYNFSTILDHAGSLVSRGAVHTLLMLSSEKGASETALATLGNLVVTVVGKKAMESDPLVPESLIEIMTWEEKPKCQELTAYILMILAHRSSVQRDKMKRSGIVPILLEVALLGTPLAQKRALRILQWFKDGRQMKIGAHSGPQTGRVLMGFPVSREETKEGKKAIKKMVKQSLDKNMELIMRRADASGDASKLKSLIVSSSSKSLPY